MKLRQRIARWIWPGVQLSAQDMRQITYTLERQIIALDHQSNMLLNSMDYSAEFPYEEAENLRIALAYFKELLDDTHPKTEDRVVVGPDTSTH